MDRPPLPVPTQSYPIPGDLMVTAPADLKLLTPYVLAEQGDWFESEIRFVRRWLQPGMGVVDIGANFGLYTLTAARAVGPAGWVAAFEPASLPRACLAHSLRVNTLPQVELHDQALSDHVGTARLGLAANSELNCLGPTGTSGETVPLTTLDAASISWSRAIHFLKLDAEGEELRILEGSERFFGTHDPLVLFELRHGEVVNQGLLEAFRRRGFATFRHVPGLDILAPLAPDTEPDPFQLNVFASRPATTARLIQAGLVLTEPAPLPPASDDASATSAVATSWFQARPWARLLWPGGLPQSTAPDAAAYLQAIVDILRSENPALSPALRWALASRALACLRTALARRSTPSRLLTAARVALSLGERSFAVHCLQQTGATVDPSAVGNEPFLPPEARFDDLDPAGNLPAALAAMHDEPLLEFSSFSVYFARKSALPALLRLARNPLRSAAAERRLAAARHLLPLGPG